MMLLRHVRTHISSASRHVKKEIFFPRKWLIPTMESNYNMGHVIIIVYKWKNKILWWLGSVCKPHDQASKMMMKTFYSIHETIL